MNKEQEQQQAAQADRDLAAMNKDGGTTAEPGDTVILREAERQADIVGDKQMRKDLDRTLQIMKLLPPSRERALAITKVQEGIMWMGMDLKRLNTPNPYPESYNPDNTKIEPTADGLTL